MNPFTIVWRGIRSLGKRRPKKEEIDEELQFHIEQRTAENVAAGISPEQAGREARKRFGNFQGIREECRDRCGASFGEATLQDICFGLRMLRKDPGFTTVAVLTLALGIGANTAIFSVINAVLLHPLPYHDPDRLVVVSQSNVKRGLPQVVVTPAVLREWREQNSVFEELGGQIYESANLTGAERPEHLHAAWTTPNYFSVFGVPPLIGRTFISDDKPTGGHRVVVLSYSLWRRNFGGDRNVIGQSITLNGLNYMVVGVMPENFKIYRSSAVFGQPTGDLQPELWSPYPGWMEERTNHYFLAFGRLKPGTTAAQAQSDLNVISERSGKEWPSQADWRASVQPLSDQVVGGSRPALRLLLGAVGFVLLIACANVANLSLARSVARAKEFAVRSALGAARLRILRQVLVESATLALLGGALGVLLARWGVAALTALQPASLPRLDEIHVDGSVLVFTLIISFLTGLAFGLVPAFYASKPNLLESLKESGPNSSEGRHGQRVRSVLLVAEVALAMILLAGAGLMIQSFVNLTRVNPGFAPEQLVAFDFSLGGSGYNETSKRIGLIKQLREALQSKPGVNSVASVYGLPFGTMLNSMVGMVFDGRPESDPLGNGRAAWRVVSPSYFKTMNISLLKGRAFSEELDTANSTPAAIINETFAHKYFPAEEPVGRRIQIFTLSTNWHEVVGVLKDVKPTGLDASAVPEIYQSDSQNGEWILSLVLRSSLPSRELEKMVRDAAMALNKDLPLFNTRTMEQAISTSVAPRRFTMMLVGLFAVLALTLTAVGIYGVVSYSVSRRTREIGIRMALGSSGRSILCLMLRQGVMLGLIGIGIGLAGSLALTPLIANQLFGIRATDPGNLAIVALVLMVVVLAACYLPARRATQAGPMTSLRYQ